MKTLVATLPAGDVLVYKYGIRLDKDCLEHVNTQINLSRRLYNDLIAYIRNCVSARSAREFELAGQPAKDVQLTLRKTEMD